MKAAYFDCFSGISGDMVLGALVDAGADHDALRDAIHRLGLEGVEIRFEREMQGYLAGTRAHVIAPEGPKHRHLPEILKIIEASSLSSLVKDRAAAIFRRLAEAEAAVHGIPVEKVHFHEVGALDAIVDIVGASAGLELLGVEKIFASAIALGRGEVQCRHGLLPIPAPAVVRLTQDFEVRFTEIDRELTTPTGAAILTALAQPGEKPSSLIMESVGYGLGSQPGEGLPNALRILTGTLPEGRLEEVVLLQTNLDDVTGEAAGHLIDRCLEEGALDAFAIPVQMKKSRPGLLFCALTRLDRQDRIRTLIHLETGTLGIRIQRVHRSVLDRESQTAKTSLGEIRVKKARLPDGTVFYSPEHDEAA
ncbi:MAG: nickel pincer cofactor biosynthesis protein LarC, partial [Planctomycetota bacterium]